MSDVEEWRDFVAYQLNDDGIEEELTHIEIDNISTELNNERVLLLCRYDLRKIYIWKGPRSPVRKRFISSRVAARLQEKATNTRGMHLKIISVDAGDEPVDFLSSFNVKSYEITEEDKPEDLYYVTNAEKQKMAELEAAKKQEEESQKPQEYWSPILDEAKGGDAASKGRMVDLNEEKRKAMERMRETAVASPAPRPVPRQASAPASAMPPADVDKILKDITEAQEEEDFKRLNVIIGTELFGPSTIKQQVFGKEVEKEKWDLIKSVPEGRIEIDSKKLVIHVKDNKIVGVEVLMDKDGTVTEHTKEEEKKTADSEPKKAGKRNLPQIPKAE